MLPPENVKEGQRFLVWDGEHIGAIVRLVKTRHDVYGGITKPPRLLHKGREIACPWAKLRRITPYTLLATLLIRLHRVLYPLVRKYLFGTI